MMLGGSDDGGGKANVPDDTEYDEVKAQLTAPDEETQRAGGERLVELGESHPAWLASHPDLVEHALTSDYFRVRNKGMRATLFLVEEDRDAGRELISPAIQALQKEAGEPESSELMQALLLIHRDTDASISAGDEVYAQLIRSTKTGVDIVNEDATRFIGEAVVETPESFPETLDAMVDVLDEPSAEAIVNAASVLGIVARDDPELLPAPERIEEKLETVREWQMVENHRATLEKTLRLVREVRDAGASDPTQ